MTHHTDAAVLSTMQAANDHASAGLPAGHGRLLGALHATARAGSGQHAAEPAQAAAGRTSLVDALCNSLNSGPAPALQSSRAPPIVLPGPSRPACR